MKSDDLTLKTLLDVRSEFADALPQPLLEQCYSIQKRFQFSSDRAAVVNEMERLIDEAAARQYDCKDN